MGTRTAALHPTNRRVTIMRNVIIWATVAAGAIAAYLMYRRGESFGKIASDSVQHPVSSLVREAQNAA